MQYRTIESPIGPLLLAGDDEGVRFLLFSTGRRHGTAETRVGTGSWLAQRHRVATDVVLRGKAARVRYSAGAAGHAVSAAGVARAVRHSLRRDDQLRRARAAHRQSQSGARRRSRKRIESDLDHHSVSPRHRQQRIAHRLRRRASDQKGTARSRTRPDSAAVTVDRRLSTVSLRSQRHHRIDARRAPRRQQCCQHRHYHKDAL